MGSQEMVIGVVDGDEARAYSAWHLDQHEIVDKETGSRWNAITGDAFDGPLAGKSLQRVFQTQVFWFAWRNFFPKTRLWGVEK